MAGNEQRYRIAPDGRARGARGTGGADAFGDLAIARQLAYGNREQRLPDLDLPRGAEKLYRQLDEVRSSRVGGHSEYLRSVVGCRVVVQPEARMGPARAHVCEQRRFLVFVAEGKTAKPAFRCHDERAAEKRRPKPVGDVEAGPTLRVIAGRHRLDLERKIIKPRWTR